MSRTEPPHHVLLERGLSLDFAEIVKGANGHLCAKQNDALH